MHGMKNTKFRMVVLFGEEGGVLGSESSTQAFHYICHILFLYNV